MSRAWLRHDTSTAYAEEARGRKKQPIARMVVVGLPTRHAGAASPRVADKPQACSEWAQAGVHHQVQELLAGVGKKQPRQESCGLDFSPPSPTLSSQLERALSALAFFVFIHPRNPPVDMMSILKGKSNTLQVIGKTKLDISSHLPCSSPYCEIEKRSARHFIDGHSFHFLRDSGENPPQPLLSFPMFLPWSKFLQETSYFPGLS